MTAAAPERTASPLTVQGYLGNRSYALTMDPTATDPVTGVVTACTHPDVIPTIEGHTGETASPGAPTFGTVPMGLDTIEGVLAALHAYTEVTSTTGDLPDTLAEDPANANIVY